MVRRSRIRQPGRCGSVDDVPVERRPVVFLRHRWRHRTGADRALAASTDAGTSILPRPGGCSAARRVISPRKSY